MGASSSTEQVSSEQREVESLAASTGALPLLQKVFSTLSDPETKQIPLNSLQQCFCLKFNNLICEAHQVPEFFPALLDHLGSSIVDQFFVAEKGGLSWIEFVRGYVKCCGRMSVSSSLNTFLRVFTLAVNKASLPFKAKFESDDDDIKISGSFLATDVLMLLWMCWIMSWKSRKLKVSKGKADPCLPDISPLVLSAIVSCTEGGNDLDVWGCNLSTLEVELPAGKFHMWVLTTVPNLTDCFTQFVHMSLQNSVTSEDKSDSSSTSVVGVSSGEIGDSHLLNYERAWAISLTMRSTVNEEILRACFPCNADGTDETLLYRSSLDGKGLNRFWSNVDGYHGPLLVLISATSGDINEGNNITRRWIIGALTQQGFESKDVYYGSSGNLYAISPIFHAFSPSGKEKNFVYSHSHPTSRYEPHPKPVGIAFGGSIGNERIFLDDDFAKVTVRHHAVDKTYQPGPLFPNQGFLPVEALVLEVEVWGLGGKTARETQTSHQKREQLFTQQRRKVDLKTFSNWEDSPEKLMMDMVGDPNRGQRQRR